MGCSRPPPWHPGRRCHGREQQLGADGRSPGARAVTLARKRVPGCWQLLKLEPGSREAGSTLARLQQAGQSCRAHTWTDTATPSKSRSGSSCQHPGPCAATPSLHSTPTGQGRWTGKSRLLASSKQRELGNREGMWGHVPWRGKTVPRPKKQDSCGHSRGLMHAAWLRRPGGTHASSHRGCT